MKNKTTQQKRLNTLLVAAFLFAASLCVLVWFSLENNSGEKPAALEESTIEQGKLLHIDGYQASNYIEGRLASHIEADSLEIAPHKISVFKVRFYDRFTLKNARISLSINHLDRLPSFLPFDKLQDLQRGIINGLALTFLEAKQATLRVTAEKADINSKKGVIKLEKVLVEDPASDKKIAGRVAFWSTQNKTLKIPGQFLAQNGTSKTTGEGIEISPTFSLSENVFGE